MVNSVAVHPFEIAEQRSKTKNKFTVKKAAGGAGPALGHQRLGGGDQRLAAAVLAFAAVGAAVGFHGIGVVIQMHNRTGAALMQASVSD